MIWTSLTVALVVVGLVMLVFCLLQQAVETKHEVLARQEALLQKELEALGLSTAVRHFRHDLANLLDGVIATADLARYNLRDNPDKSAEALEVVEQHVAETMAYLAAFRPGSSGREPAVSVDMGALCANVCKPFESEEREVDLNKPNLLGWIVKVPPIALARLIGNLLKNATESADLVVIDRHDGALVVENPVGRDEARVLSDRSAYDDGVSTKANANGQERGIGLASARQLAEEMGATLDHELYELAGEQWVRFALRFRQES